MKKCTWLYATLALLLLVSCATTDTANKQEYQSENRMLSTFRENDYDGYSWHYRDITYNKNDTTVTKKKLLSTIWITDVDPDVGQYAMLVFYDDDVFKIGTFQTGVRIQGKYRVKNSKIYLSDYNFDEEIKLFITFDTPKTTCTLHFTSDNVEYAHEMLVSGTKFFPFGSRKETGDTAKVHGYDVIVHTNTYVCNDTVRFRTRPNVDADHIPIYFYKMMFHLDTLPEQHRKADSFKKGTVIKTLAKTTRTETIDNKTAPWYYISVFDGFEGSQYGWVFGAYFDEYVEEKEEHYRKILRKSLGLPDNNIGDVILPTQE